MLYMEILIERLEIAFNLSYDLLSSVTSDQLSLKLKDLPSNTMGGQFYCLIGARESYLNGIKNEEWSGFSCSLDDLTSKKKVSFSLKKSASDTLEFLNHNELNKVQIELLLLLLEHEIQHHGQLIRYIYGNKLTFPKSWNKRYSV